MKINHDGFEIVKKFEGFRSKAYLCPAGVWAIGYGHTGGVKEGDRISEERAEELLRKELDEVASAVSELITTNVSHNQFSALVSFAHSIGLTAFERSTLLKKFNKGDYVGAAEEFSKWNKGRYKVLEGLVRRRLEERELFNK